MMLWLRPVVALLTVLDVKYTSCCCWMQIHAFLRRNVC